MARVSRLNVLLESEVKDKFQIYAKNLGLTESALGAYVIGHWILQQESAKNILGSVQNQLMEVFKDAERQS